MNFGIKHLSFSPHFELVVAGIMYLVFVIFFTITIKSRFMPWAVFFILGLLVVKLLIIAKKIQYPLLAGKKTE